MLCFIKTRKKWDSEFWGVDYSMLYYTIKTGHFPFFSLFNFYESPQTVELAASVDCQTTPKPLRLFKQREVGRLTDGGMRERRE